MPSLSTIAFNKDAFPTPRRSRPVAGETPKSKPAKTTRFWLRRSPRANQAFVRFAVASSAALSAIALNSTCVLEPFIRRGYRPEPWFSPVYLRGPAPMFERNVVAPGEYSKRFLRLNPALS